MAALNNVSLEAFCKLAEKYGIGTIILFFSLYQQYSLNIERKEYIKYEREINEKYYNTLKDIVKVQLVGEMQNEKILKEIDGIETNQEKVNNRVESLELALNKYIQNNNKEK